MPFSKRIQSFEFLDLPWVTGWVRQGILEYLNFLLYRMTPPYDGVEDILAAWAKEAGADTVLDLGSGGGGHIDWLLRRAQKENITLPRFVFSDLFPDANVPTYQRFQARYGENKVGYLTTSVDACSPPKDAPRLRMMFSTFHHLTPKEARRMLESACRDSDGILIAEGLRRALLPTILMAFLLPVYMIVMPFLAPHFTLRRLLFSLIVPIIPLMITYDGVISMLRAYTADEIVSLFPDDAKEHFKIESHTIPYLFGIFSTTVVTALRKK